LIIILIAVALILVLAIGITLSVILAKPEDDGRIHNKVYAAGVDLSGMTPEQAKQALHDATDNTYSKLGMSISILEETVTLSPADTGAKLDVDAVVEAAYNYGRTENQPLGSGYYVPVTQYLNLNKAYIDQALAALGEKYSTTLTQPTITVTGERPSLKQDIYDTSVIHQTLSIYMGTAEYGLNTKDLYDQIMEAYNSNLFQVAAQCSKLEPETVDVDAIYRQYCSDPVDAQIDNQFNTTPEVYGYGFDLEAVRAQIENAAYGDTLEIPLCFVRPSITEEDLAGDLFQDLLGEAYTVISGSNDLKKNLAQACQTLNGLVLKSGDVFTFNGLIGQPSTRNGYRQVQVMVGKKLEKVVGGGISQVASTLYIATVKAELEVLERHNHAFAPVFVEPGLDADIAYGSKDFRFTNTTDQPMRLEATIEGDYVVIRLWGTDHRDYTVEIENKVVQTYTPVTLEQKMPEDNPGGYADGNILVEGITGYDVITYITYVYDNGNVGTQEIEVGQSHYDKRNEVVVRIETEIPDPTDPSDPTEPSDPTDPSDPTEPSEPEDGEDE
jgi:vancomycin resistance protein YoaR